MAVPEESLDIALLEYERRKQDETRRTVQRALRLEEARKRGVDYLRRYAVGPARDVAGRLQGAGHRVVHQEFLDAYPPNVRVNFWPKPGPLDSGPPKQSTLELVWGDPEPDKLCARRLTPEGRELQGSARPPSVEPTGPILFTHEPESHQPSSDVLDELWVKEQLLNFVRESLKGA